MIAVTVIIPFFQRQPDLLRQAVSSVFQQELLEPVRTIIVDDSSPISAHGEIKGLDVPDNHSVEVIKVANGGPGAARNRGLDLVEESEFVAFLDSDDVWAPCHLRRAVSALRKGRDIYISDWMPLGNTESAHEERNLASESVLERSDLLPDASELRSDFLLQEVRRPFASLPTMVYSWSKFHELRFDEDLTIASEDLFFRYRMGLLYPSVVVSHKIEMHCGAGVNINASRRWGDSLSLKMLFSKYKSILKSERILISREDVMAIIMKMKKEQQNHLAKAILHDIRNRYGSGAIAALPHIARMPHLWAALPVECYHVISEKVRNASDVR